MRILKQKAIHKVGMLVLALGLTITAWASDFSMTKMQAEQGDIAAQVRLTTMYSLGIGVAQDGAQSQSWLSQACDSGVTISCEQ
jgi:TPR repeat protein